MNEVWQLNDIGQEIYRMNVVPDAVYTTFVTRCNKFSEIGIRFKQHSSILHVVVIYWEVVSWYRGIDTFLCCKFQNVKYCKRS